MQLRFIPLGVIASIAASVSARTIYYDKHIDEVKDYYDKVFLDTVQVSDDDVKAAYIKYTTDGNANDVLADVLKRDDTVGVTGNNFDLDKTVYSSLNGGVVGNNANDVLADVLKRDDTVGVTGNNFDLENTADNLLNGAHVDGNVNDDLVKVLKRDDTLGVIRNIVRLDKTILDSAYGISREVARNLKAKVARRSGLLSIIPEGATEASTNGDVVLADGPRDVLRPLTQS